MESKKTVRLVSTIALMKERELWEYRNKVIELEQRIDKDSNNKLNTYRYNLIQSRFMKLKTTIQNLKQLELQLHK